MFKWLIVAVLPMVLSGCQFLAYAQEDGMLLHNAAKSYVAENVGYRKAIRDACFKLLQMEAAAVLSQSDMTVDSIKAMRNKLGDSYPPVVTLSILADKDFSSLDTTKLCE